MPSERKYIINDDLGKFLDKELGILRYVMDNVEYHPNMGDKTYIVTWNGKQYSAQYTYDLVRQIERVAFTG